MTLEFLMLRSNTMNDLTVFKNWIIGITYQYLWLFDLCAKELNYLH